MAPRLLVSGLFILLAAGCAERPLEPPGIQHVQDMNKSWSWNTSEHGSIGILVDVQGSADCSIEGWGRGRSTVYGILSHFGFVGTVDQAIGTARSSVDATHEDPSFAPGVPIGPTVHLTLANHSTGLELEPFQEWQVYSSIQERAVQGTARFYAAFRDLEASVPWTPDDFYSVDWMPTDNATTAQWRLNCSSPVHATLRSVARFVHAFDDWTFRGNGAALMAGTSSGLRVGGATASSREIDIAGNMTIFVGFSPDVEKMSMFEVQGPGLNHTWLSPPTSYVKLGAYQEYAQAGPGTYELRWTQAGATPFSAFHTVIYDWS